MLFGLYGNSSDKIKDIREFGKHPFCGAILRERKPSRFSLADSLSGKVAALRQAKPAFAAYCIRR